MAGGIFEYSDPIISKRRKGDSTDPYVDLSRSHQVVNGKIVLEEIPDKFTKVTVTGDSITWYETDNEINNTNEYKVDYTFGIIYLDSSHNGKTLTCSYKGTGTFYFPSSRVWSETDSYGDVTKTLQEIISSGQNAITNLEQVETVIQNAENATQDAISATTNANDSASLADQATLDAQTATQNAIQATSDATTAATNANTKITETETARQNVITATSNAESKITDVESRMSTIETEYTDTLKPDIVQATSDANIATTNAESKISNVESRMQTIETEYTDTLKPEILDATDNANSAANTTKINWKGTLSTKANLPSSPSLGDTYQVENDGTASNNGTWRWDGSSWIKINSPQAYDSRLVNIENDLSEQNSQTTTLTHGLNIIESDTPSDLKVEFYGNTLVNPISNFNNLNYKHPNATVVSSQELQHNATSSWQNSEFRVSVKPNEYYIFHVEADGGYVEIDEYSGQTKIKDNTVFSNNSTVKKFVTQATTDSLRIFYGTGSNTTGTFTFKKPKLYNVSADLYNKIGVSLLDADVEKMFPYVSGVAHVKNPVLSVEGQQLFNIYDVVLHANAEITNSNTFTLNAKSTWENSSFIRNVKKSQYYTLSASLSDGAFIQVFDGETHIDTVSGLNITKTWNIASDYIKLRPTNGTSGAGTFTFSNIMLNLGSTASPYVPYNPSYLYAETTLYGNDNKKDILRRNESLDVPRWEKTKWWETKVLDGAGNWAYHSSTSGEGYKSVRLRLGDGSFNLTSYTDVVKKYDGKILKSVTYSEDLNKPDLSRLAQGGADTYLYLTVSDNDADGYDLTTSQGITDFFSDKNYFLLYQLAEPVIEPVTVEGDVVVNGLTQVSVGSEFTYTEDEQGNRTYTITPDNERVGANLTDVKVTYDQSLKSSYDSTVTKVSDIATDQSILKRQMLDVLVRLDALEGV